MYRQPRDVLIHLVDGDVSITRMCTTSAALFTLPLKIFRDEYSPVSLISFISRPHLILRSSSPSSTYAIILLLLSCWCPSRGIPFDLSPEHATLSEGARGGSDMTR
jgi:hypothetical protein